MAIPVINIYIPWVYSIKFTQPRLFRLLFGDPPTRRGRGRHMCMLPNVKALPLLPDDEAAATAVGGTSSPGTTTLTNSLAQTTSIEDTAAAAAAVASSGAMMMQGG